MEGTPDEAIPYPIDPVGPAASSQAFFLGKRLKEWVDNNKVVDQGMHTSELMAGLKDLLQTAMDGDILPPDQVKNYATRVREITEDAYILLLSDKHDVSAALKLKRMNKDVDDILEELIQFVSAFESARQVDRLALIQAKAHDDMAHEN